MAKKRFSKRVTRKTQYKLTPKDAETIIRQDFTDSHNNKHICKMDIKPHKPSIPTIEGNIQYKDNK